MKQRKIQRPGVGTFLVRENIELVADVIAAKAVEQHRQRKALRQRRMQETCFEVAA
jgi:hypothetical protein